VTRFVAIVPALLLVFLVAPRAAAEPARPPKLDVQAAMKALTTQQVYRAPGAVAQYDGQQVAKALGNDIKLLVEPYTGTYEKGNNYPTDDDYITQVYTPLTDWVEDHHVKLIDVTGLYVRAIGGGGGAFGPSDLAEARTLSAYNDVTSSLMGLIGYLRTGATHYESPPAPPMVPPTPSQLDPVATALRADPVYNAAGSGSPIGVKTPDQLRQLTGFSVRIAAFPPVPLGQPLVDYAPALAKAFPGDEIAVTYGVWTEVAGPNQQVLRSARDYAYGRYETATSEQGVDMNNRVYTILQRTYDLVRRHPFSQPEPPPYDLQQQISAVAPWVLLGSAVIIGGGALAVWLRRRAEAERAEKVALRRESARAMAAIAALSGRVLRDDQPSAAGAERLATANTMFEQARTPQAMVQVRKIAEQGGKAMRR
jgi:hypothetical protein